MNAKSFGDGKRRNFIEPSLLLASNDEISAVIAGKATRPPVVGRETPLDPERTKRYSSEDDQLQEYLKALRKKTNEITDDVESPQDKGDIRSTNVRLQTNLKSLFLKKESLEVIGKVCDVDKTTLRSSVSAVGSRTLSAALQKAQFFTNKYTKVSPQRVTLTTNVEPSFEKSSSEKSESPASKQVEVRVSSSNGDDKEEDSSVKSIFNVKSFEDFASEIEHVAENVFSFENRESESYKTSSKDEDESENREKQLTDSSFKLELRSFRDLEATEVREESVIVKKDVSVSSVDSFPSRRTGGELESNDYSYEDDFEVDGVDPTSSVSVRRSRDRHDAVVSSMVEGSVSVRKQRKKSTLSRGVQTSVAEVGLGPDPNFVLQSQFQESEVPIAAFVDPQRVSSYVVSQEALQVLSSYNPSVMALNEILRNQLKNTRVFVEAQRRNYIASITHLKPDYEYTTLEKTKALISNHKRKKEKMKATK